VDNPAQVLLQSLHNNVLGGKDMQNEIIERLRQSVVEGNVKSAEEWARKAVEEGVDPVLAIEEGLIKAVKKVGEDFGLGILFLPELVQGGDACKAGMTILEEDIREKGGEWQAIGTLVIGTVQDDVHDIGKSLVSSFFKASGFKVIDLGVNVPKEAFVAAVQEHRPGLLGLSSLLTTTVREQKYVIEALEEAGLRSNAKVLVGGGAVTPGWAEEIGADGYGQDAQEAVVIAKELLNIE
jgi:corrinoid protein of di/trimethylamine methyltransferase